MIATICGAGPSIRDRQRPSGLVLAINAAVPLMRPDIAVYGDIECLDLYGHASRIAAPMGWGTRLRRGDITGSPVDVILWEDAIHTGNDRERCNFAMTAAVWIAKWSGADAVRFLGRDMTDAADCAGNHFGNRKADRWKRESAEIQHAMHVTGLRELP